MKVQKNTNVTRSHFSKKHSRTLRYSSRDISFICDIMQVEEELRVTLLGTKIIPKNVSGFRGIQMELCMIMNSKPLRFPAQCWMRLIVINLKKSY